MDLFSPVDWERVLVPQIPLLETFLRGSLVYLTLFTLLRVVLQRQQAGSVRATDLLVIVLIADAAQNAMAGDYRSVPDGIVLVATILGWSYALDWLGYRFPRVQRLLFPPPLLLVQDGRLLRRHMRQELVTEEELMSQLREQGVEELREVKAARMEGDGRLSVITHKDDQHRRRGKVERITR